VFPGRLRRRAATAAGSFSDSIARLRPLFRRQNLSDSRLKIGPCGELLRGRRVDRSFQLFNLLLIRRVRQDRNLKLALEVHQIPPWILAGSALIDKRLDLVALRVGQIQSP